MPPKHTFVGMKRLVINKKDTKFINISDFALACPDEHTNTFKTKRSILTVFQKQSLSKLQDVQQLTEGHRDSRQQSFYLWLPQK